LFEDANGLSLSGDHVALEVEAYVDGFAILHGFAAPNTIVVLLKLANVGKAVGLEPRFGLAFSEAIGARNRCAGIVGVLCIDRVVPWPLVGGGILILGDRGAHN